MRLLPILVGLLLVLELLNVYRGWRVMLVGLLGAWLIAYLWARSLAMGLRLDRELRIGLAQVDDQIMERLTVRNMRRYPALWVEVEDHSSLPNHRVGRGFAVGGIDLVRWFVDTTCSRRGLFNLGPISLHTGDPLGIYSVTLSYRSSVPILVLPQVVSIPPFELASGGRAEDGRTGLRTMERTVSAASVREYQPGDVDRWIHWPTSARRDELYVRTFDAVPAGDLWILLDTNRHVQCGENENSTHEHAVILAASLADREIRLGRSVGLVASDPDLVWLPPRSGEGQRWQILQALALVSQGERSLAEMLHGLSGTLQRDASLLILTPDTNWAWIEALNALRQAGIEATVMLLDPRSFGGENEYEPLLDRLVDLAVQHHLVRRDLLEHASERRKPQRISVNRIDFIGDDTRSHEAWEAIL